MKIYINKFDDGSVTYGADGVLVSFVGKQLVETIEYNMDDDTARDVLEKPEKYKVVKDKVMLRPIDKSKV